MRKRPPPPTKDGTTGERLDTNTFVSQVVIFIYCKIILKHLVNRYLICQIDFRQNGTLRSPNSSFNTPNATLRTPKVARHSPQVCDLVTFSCTQTGIYNLLVYNCSDAVEHFYDRHEPKYVVSINPNTHGLKAITKLMGSG
jgi:hypothetical protein